MEENDQLLFICTHIISCTKRSVVKNHTKTFKVQIIKLDKDKI